MPRQHLSNSSLLSLAFVASFCFSSAFAVPSKTPAVDLVVYGGTASGVITAYSAAKQGLHVVLLEPTRHLGGMVTGGLSATDYAYFPIIGGYTRKFYAEAATTYGKGDLEHPSDFLSEPKVGEAIFNRWLKEAKIDVRLGRSEERRVGKECRSRRPTKHKQQ